MTAEFDPTTVPINPAATVMLVRDSAADGGLEVFMMQRTLKSGWARGMYVFPGGRLDEVDGGPSMQAACEGITDEHASSLLQIDHGGLAYWVAAIRECFEEAGVLLARSATTGDEIRFDDPDVASRFNTARHRVHDGTLSLVELCEAEGLRLTADRMVYVAHWITPLGESRRFDTRFFLALAPQSQEPLHDDKETIGSLWVQPADALARERAGELLMLPPTIASLQFLAEHDTAEAAMTAAACIGVPPTLLPKIRTIGDDGRFDLLMPGDPGYDDLD